MKKTLKVSMHLLITLFCIRISDVSASYYDPRVSVWGLAGPQDQVRGDALFPLLGDQDNLIYTDLQGSYTRTNSNHVDDANYIGAAAGFRKLYNYGVYGAYLFFDRDQTQLHNTFNVLNPGLEAFFPEWDFRINGYFPVGRRDKTVSIFPSHLGCGDCGTTCGDCQFIRFKGHKQFENRFSFLEKASSGADAEIGYTFHQLHNTQLHAGIYYFNFGNTNNFNNMKNLCNTHNTNHILGVEGRLEVPVTHRWAVTLASSYDNYQHGTIMAGLRFDLFAPPETNDMSNRMVDPISRNLGSLKTGSGIPTVKVKRNDGWFLTRNHIYFFTSSGGSAFVNKQQSGTFENPLSNDQFDQSVVNQIGNNANFYFNTGTYVIMGPGAPNSQINLLKGDSIYGRTSNFMNSAIGDERPILLGRINLLEGNNTIDSTQLINNASHSGISDLNLIALNIQNASNILLCNDNINATATVDGDLQPFFSNTALGIFAQNSEVLIKKSSISADAVVTGTIFFSGIGGLNIATGIGGNATTGTITDFTGNKFTILNSTVNGSATAGISNGENTGIGIGGNAAFGGVVNFNNNSFVIGNSVISGNAVANSLGFSSGHNTAIGIGTRDENGVTIFNDNTFEINSSQVSGTASVSGVDNGVNSSVGIGASGQPFFVGVDFLNNKFNLNNTTISASSMVESTDIFGLNKALGIGLDEGGTNFNNNTFNLLSTNVNAAATMSGSNSGRGNVALGIGNSSSFNFEDNTFNLIGSSVNANALVDGDNTTIFNGNAAIGIGTFDSGSTTNPTSNNTFNFTNSSINANSTVGGDNSSVNTAIGIGGFLSQNFVTNTFNLIDTTINANATVVGDNTTFLNEAIGIGTGVLTGGFSNNIFSITNSSINTTATVNGNNSSLNDALGISLQGGGNSATIKKSTINTLAKVDGTNIVNVATGLIASGLGDVITIDDSVVNTTASASSGTNIATGRSGNVISHNTIYNTTP